MRYVIFILFSILVFSCDKNTKIHQDNISIVEQYVQAVEERDNVIMERLLSDDYVGYGPSINHSIGKQEAIANWLENAESLYEKIEHTKAYRAGFTIEDGENQGNWVTTWAELKIHYIESEDVVTILTHSNYKIENGQIVKSYTSYNVADALEQLGYVFINPNYL